MTLIQLLIRLISMAAPSMRQRFVHKKINEIRRFSERSIKLATELV